MIRLSKRKTNEEVQSILDRYELTWLSGEYVAGCKRTITCIDKEGYKHLVSINSLNSGRPPRFVDVANKYTLENINIWLSKFEHLKNHKCISSEYKHSKTQKLDFITEEGYKYQNTWIQFSQQKTIGIFEKLNPYVMENIRLWLELNKPHLTVVSDVYNNTREDMIFKCKCGRDVIKPFLKIQNMEVNSCECRSNIDRYMPKSRMNIEENKESLKMIDAKVYIIRCYNDTEMFYKIGYTKYDVDRRFKDKSLMPYQYDIVNIIETNVYDAIVEERKLHMVNDRYSYKPLIQFTGNTECFSELDDIGV